jgi:hypothetical protein
MINSELYYNLFKEGAGEKVLLELTGLYYDRISYTRGDPYETAYKEGQRSVLEFILRKIAEKNFLNQQEEI